jgi:hypothetical protein
MNVRMAWLLLLSVLLGVMLGCKRPEPETKQVPPDRQPPVPEQEK